MIKSFSVVRIEAGVNFAELSVKYEKVLRLQAILARTSPFDPSFPVFLGAPDTFGREISPQEFAKLAVEREKTLNAKPPEAYPDPGKSLKRSSFSI